MKKSSILLIFGLLPFFCFAQTYQGAAAERLVKDSKKVHISPKTNHISYVKLQDDKHFPLSEVEDWVINAFELPSQTGLIPLQSRTDKRGTTHHRFEQSFQGIPVIGGYGVAHGTDETIHSFNGDFFDITNATSTPSIGEQTAIDVALAKIGAKQYRWEAENLEARLKERTGNPDASYYPHAHLVYVPDALDFQKADFRLAYKIEVYAIDPVVHKTVYIDAVSGDIIDVQEHMCTGDVEGTAETYYSGTRTITADEFGGQYRLRQTGRPVETYDLNNGDNPASATDFVDDDNYWNNVNANQDEVATDAHWGAEMTYDYLRDIHGVNGLDGMGHPLTSYIHYGSGFVNAFWNGIEATYGDGDGTEYDPLVSIEVCGHEFFHGVTEFSSALIYSGESGGLNESFSDIFGYVVEDFGRGTPDNWLIGDEFALTGDPFRSMENPNLYACPDTYGGDFWDPFGDVHVSSGVQNYWFYLLVEGGSGFNDLGNSFEVDAIGVDAAAEIAFNNLVYYLGPSSNYAEARQYSLVIAEEIYGECADEVTAINDAWFAVGLGENISPSSFTASETLLCEVPFAVTFDALSGGADLLWDFGDGTTSTEASPTHVYEEEGSYTVSLIASGTNCIGEAIQDTTIIEDCILIDTTSIYCTASFMPTSGDLYVDECTGVLFDDGGPDGVYSNNINSQIVIEPYGASELILTFNSFYLEAGWDYLYIYDGNTASAPLIGSYTGNSLPNGDGIIEMSGGAATLVFYSDYIISTEGFEMTWVCNIIEEPPVVDFSADRSISCDGQVHFFDESSNFSNSWLWDFGDGTTSTEENPLHFYAEEGTYDVTLEACNDYGCDVATQEAIVLVDFESTACDTTLFADNEYIEVYACSGLLYDEGGPTGNYTNNFDGTVTLHGLGGNMILNFISFQLESCCDYLTIYDGPSTTSPFLGSFNGSSLDGETIEGTGSSLTLNFDTDGSVTYSGFEIQYEASGGTETPEASFEVDGLNVPLNTPVQFENTSANGGSWLWDFGDGTTSIEENPAHAYQSSGIFLVSLIASNCYGADTTGYSNVIVQGAADITVNPDNFCVTVTAGEVATETMNISNTGIGDLLYTLDGVVTGEGSSESILFYEGFNDESSFDNWTQLDNGFETSIVSSPIISGGGALRQEGGFENHYTGLTQYIEPVSPNYISFWIHPGSNILADAYVLLANGFDLGMYILANEDGQLGYPSFDGNFYGLSSYEGEQWYHIEFRNIDFTNYTFDFYIDDTSYGIGLGFSQNIEAINTIHLYNYHNSVAHYDEIIFATEPVASGSTADWLSADPIEGEINAGANEDIQLTFDATELNDGIYEYDLLVNTNVPGEETITVPCKLIVEGEPLFSLNQEAFDFGNVVVTSSANDTLCVENPGTDTLTVNLTSPEGYTIEPTNFEILPNENQKVLIIFIPESVGNFDGILTGQTNAGNFTVQLAGNGTGTPDIALDPDAICVNLIEGQDTTILVQVSNNGEGELQVNILENGGVGGSNLEVLASLYEVDLSLEYPNTLEALNSTFTDYNLVEMNTWSASDFTASLEGKDVLFFPEIEGFFTITSDVVDVVTQYVENGGTVIMCGMYYDTPQDLGLFEISNDCDGPYTIVDEEHPTMEGITAPIGWVDAVFSKEFTNPDVQTIVACDGGGSMLAYREIGAGKAIYLGYDFYEYDNTSAQMIGNVFRWVQSGVWPEWLEVNPNNLEVAVGASQTLEVQINSTGLNTGTYEYNVGLETNIPLEPTVLLPIKLNVIADPVANFVAGNTYTCDGTITFTDLSENIPTSWEWDFGDGTTSTEQNPIHQYFVSGIYSVSLTACNDVGCDIFTQTDYVEVNIEGAFCDTTLFADNVDFELNNCTGIIADDGGPDGSYSNGVESTIVIEVENADFITLKLLEFSTESCCDYVRVYDGNSTEAELLAEYRGSESPDTLLSSTNALTLYFDTDGSVTYDGFIFSYECTYSEIPPVTNFASVIDDCGNNVQFVDNSLYEPTNWEWDFGDGNTSNEQNPSITYNEPGTYMVTLATSNEFGEHSLSQEITLDFITGEMTIPEALFTGEEGSFSAESQGTSFEWDFGDGFSASIQNPSYSYSAEGEYIVSLTVQNEAGCSLFISDTLTVILDTNIDEIATNQSINIYPNPARDILNIDWQTDALKETDIQLQLINALGQVVYQNGFESTGNQWQTSIDVQRFAKGFYQIRLIVGEQIVHRKVILE